MIGCARRTVAALGLMLLGVFGLAEQAQANGQQRVVERARLVLDSFLDDPRILEEMRVYVQNAYAVLVVPELLKGGFVLGAEYGIGVLLVRDDETGSWGQPAFYALYGGSFGLQFGGQSSDVVFTIMNPRAVDQLIAHGVKLGADAGVAAGRLGAGVGAATTTNFGEDIYVFAKSKGLFGGFWLDGAYVQPKNDWNEAYYGRPVDARAILRQPTVMASAEVDALRHSLTRF